MKKRIVLYTTAFMLAFFSTPNLFCMKRDEPSDQAIKALPAPKKPRAKAAPASLCETLKNFYRDAEDKGHKAEAKIEINDKQAVWETDEQGLLPLYFAIEAGDLGVIRQILTLMGPLSPEIFSNALRLGCVFNHDKAEAIKLILKKAPQDNEPLPMDKTFLDKFNVVDVGFYKLASYDAIQALAKYKIPISTEEFETLIQTQGILESLLLQLINNQPALLNEKTICLAYQYNRTDLLEKVVKSGQGLDTILFHAGRANDTATIARLREQYPDKKQADRLIFAGALTATQTKRSENSFITVLGNGEISALYPEKLALMRETFERNLITLDEELLLPSFISCDGGAGAYDPTKPDRTQFDFETRTPSLTCISHVQKIL